MTNEEKELLLKDLCCRLPYGVMIQIPELFSPQRKVVEKLVTIDDSWYINDSGIYIENVKPYLRPMSSMTEEEKKGFKGQFGFELYIDEIWGHSLVWNTGSSDGYIDVEFELVDIDLVSVWLDKKMFDWRRIKKYDKRISMIKAGLAIEAPKDMYNKMEG